MIDYEPARKIRGGLPEGMTEGLETVIGGGRAWCACRFRGRKEHTVCCPCGWSVKGGREDTV